MLCKTFGFEKEFFFVRNTDGQHAHLPPELKSHADHCGYLLEARGKEMEDPHYARATLEVEQSRLAALAAKYGLALENLNTKELPKEFIRICLRKYGKNPGKSYFMGGHVYRTNKPRAGLHIHFGNQRQIEGRHGPVTVVDQMNIPRIVALMDKAFKDDIKEAKRMLGEYELKAWGFEYRSLPATINLNRVANTLIEIQKDE